MLSRLTMALGSLLFSLQVFAAHGVPDFNPYREIFVPLGEGRTISLSALELHPESKKWVIAIPGTSTEFDSVHELARRPEFAAFLKTGFNIAFMSRPGVFEDNFDPQMYLDSFRAKLRLSDSLAALREGFPADREFYLVTMSESSYIAPEMALAEPRIKAVVMKSGGTRPWLDEELTKMKKFERAEGAEMVRRIRSGVVPDYIFWNGYPAAALRSFDDIKAKEALMKLKIPVLAILAGNDKLIDIRGAVKDLSDVAKVPGSKLSRVILFGGGHTLHDRHFSVARHTFQFISDVANGRPSTIPGGMKSCQFLFDHKLLSLK